MKKSLLILAALLGSTYVMGQDIAPATSDGCTYDAVNGITCESRWIYSRILTPDLFTDEITGEVILPIGSTGARIAAIDPDNSKIYVGLTDATTADGSISIFDMETGAYEGDVALTVDGDRLNNTLCANNVIVDDFGNIIVVGYVATTSATPIHVYTADISTGELTLIADLQLPGDEADASGRLDYCDVIGDVTGVQAPGLFMCAINSGDGGSTAPVYRWRLEQGADAANDWYGDFDGWVSMLDWDATYPADQLSWGTAPKVKIVNDNDEFSGDYFYVDGFTTCPSLYNTAGSMIESFASAPDLAPAVGTNGVAEFSLGDKNFVVYSEAQYDVSPGCRIVVCELGAGQSFDGMQAYWYLPENGLGEVSDSGTRSHCVATKKITDENGKEAVYLLTFKCYNGIGIYMIAEEGFDDGSSKVESIDADIAAATISVVGKVITVSAEASDIAVYNLAGQKIAEVKNATEIAAPACGAYIVKAIVDGAAVVAKVII